MASRCNVAADAPSRLRSAVRPLRVVLRRTSHPHRPALSGLLAPSPMGSPAAPVGTRRPVPDWFAPCASWTDEAFLRDADANPLEVQERRR